MRQLFDLMIPFNIHGKVCTVIVRNPELIPICVVDTLSSIYKILTNWRCVWPARAISKVERETKPVRKTVVGYKRKIMRLIIITGIKIPAIRGVG